MWSSVVVWRSFGTVELRKAQTPSYYAERRHRNHVVPCEPASPAKEFHSASIIFQKRWPRRRQVRWVRPSRCPPAGRGPAPPPPAPTQARGGSSSTPPATTSSTGEFLCIREQPTSPSEAERAARCATDVFRGSFDFWNIKLSSDPFIILYCSSPRKLRGGCEESCVREFLPGPVLNITRMGLMVPCSLIVPARDDIVSFWLL